ncbi:MAG: hypothetical protein ABIR15_18485 [Chitinophagaceae bacterium]
MQASFDNIVQHLFHQPSLHSVTVDELENMAQQHPYFAAAHFLLLKKMQDTDHPQFNTQLHKTTLYFNNPLWLQFLLQPESAANFTISETSPFITNETAAAEEIDTENAPVAEEGNQTINQAPAITEPDLNTEASTETEVQSLADSDVPVVHAGIMDVIKELFNEPGDLSQQSNSEEINKNEHKEITAGFIEDEAQAAAIAESPVENVQPDNNIITTVPDERIKVETEMTGIAVSEPVTEENNNGLFNEEFSTGLSDSTEKNNEVASQPIQEIPAQNSEETVEGENETTDIILPGPVTEENDTVPAQPAFTVPFAEMANDNDTATLQPIDVTENAGGAADPGSSVTAISKEEKPLFRTIIETPAAKGDLLFEPYHTVDYFASQGIKLSKIEADSKDKLGRQLKSFTEWLKSMKKLPQVSIDKILSENEESKVVADATHSIENKEVITEAMAEVFEKQGLTEKAADVYRKLSLLNPGKSAYFAAKIEGLKQ